MSATGRDETVFGSGTSIRQWDVRAAGGRELTIRLVRFSRGRRLPVSEERLTLAPGKELSGRIALLTARAKPKEGVDEFRLEVKFTPVVSVPGSAPIGSNVATTSEHQSIIVKTDGSLGLAIFSLGGKTGMVLLQAPGNKEGVLFAQVMKGGLGQGPYISASSSTLEDLRKQSTGGAEAFAILLEWEPRSAGRTTPAPRDPPSGSAAANRP